MTFEVTFTISPPLNFLGYARERISRGKVFLWSRDTEMLFACDRPLESVLSEIPGHMREIVEQYKDPFLREWPSFSRKLVKFKKKLERIWESTSEEVIHLMGELGIFHSQLVEVFPVMPFFRHWPRSNPLSMPARPLTDKEILGFLAHEILHRTTDSYGPGSLWYWLTTVFIMKKVPKEKRFLIQHALIYVISEWIVSEVLESEFVKPTLVEGEGSFEMGQYIDSISEIFRSPFEEKKVMEFAEKIVACCIL